MEDFTLVGIGVALLLIILSFIFFYAIRDTNQTTRFVTSQKCETKTFISKTELEGKKFEVAAKERIEENKAKTAEGIKKMDVLMHQATMTCQMDKHEKKLEQTTIVESSKVKQTEIQCQTAKELAGMNIGFQQLQLQSEDSRFKSNLEFQKIALESSHNLSSQALALDSRASDLMAETNKYIADKALEGQLCWNSGETARVDLQCNTNLALGREAASLQREQQDFQFRLANKKITSRENCFREQMEFNKTREHQKTERMKMKALSSTVKVFGDLAGSIGTPTRGLTSVLSRGLEANSGFGDVPSLQNTQHPSLQELPD